ncbi:MAG: hypothetical protein ACLGIN_01525 [Candidatus Sericytochromatia bacterium]
MSNQAEEIPMADEVKATIRQAFEQAGVVAGLKEATFYSGDEWREMEEPYLQDAVLVMVVEGLAYVLMHDDDFMESLDILLGPLDVYADFGEEWQVGFIEN